MKVEVVKSEGLAHNSYYHPKRRRSSRNRSTPRLHNLHPTCSKDCAKIKYILETHRNEDYVIGSLELQNMTEAEIAHSKELPFKYGEHNLSDEDNLNVGNTKIKSALHSGAHKRIALLHNL
jgi:hydroxyacylglutathione hydrolase